VNTDAVVSEQDHAGNEERRRVSDGRVRWDDAYLGGENAVVASLVVGLETSCARGSRLCG